MAKEVFDKRLARRVYRDAEHVIREEFKERGMEVEPRGGSYTGDVLTIKFEIKLQPETRFATQSDLIYGRVQRGTVVWVVDKGESVLASIERVRRKYYVISIGDRMHSILFSGCKAVTKEEYEKEMNGGDNNGRKTS